MKPPIVHFRTPWGAKTACGLTAAQSPKVEYIAPGVTCRTCLRALGAR